MAHQRYFLQLYLWRKMYTIKNINL